MNPLHRPARLLSLSVLTIGLAATALPAAARVDVQVGIYAPGVAVGYYAPPPPPRVVVYDYYPYRAYPPPRHIHYAPPPPPAYGGHWGPPPHGYYRYEREYGRGWRR